MLGVESSIGPRSREAVEGRGIFLGQLLMDASPTGECKKDGWEWEEGKQRQYSWRLKHTVLLT